MRQCPICEALVVLVDLGSVSHTSPPVVYKAGRAVNVVNVHLLTSSHQCYKGQPPLRGADALLLQKQHVNIVWSVVESGCKDVKLDVA